MRLVDVEPDDPRLVADVFPVLRELRYFREGMAVTSFHFAKSLDP